jgi:uncharacterized damage-inducible protein DinB
MLEDVTLIFKLNTGFVRLALDELPAEDFWRRPSDGGNPIGWMLGHITGARTSLLTRLGHPMKTPWGNIFSRGMALGTADTYPTQPELEAAWKDTHHKMRDAFAGISDALLAEKAGRPIGPFTDPTVRELMTFLAFHESYHVGQMAYLRRLFGHGGVAG